MSRQDRDAMDSYFRNATANQTPQHCKATAQPIGDGRWECPADGAVFGIDYESGDIDWQEK